MSHAQTSQPIQTPTFINLPQPSSNPGTPSETPGTPTSTTTSLSAVSTTAIKDGQRGGHIPPLSLGGGGGGGSQRIGHQYNPFTNSLEAERADRISRLTGLSGMTTLRPSYAANRGSGASVASGGGGGSVGNRFSGSGVSPFAATTSSGGGGGFGTMSTMAVPGPLTPAFFDAQGQPVAITKMSTVGTASATDSISGRTLDDTDTLDGDTMTEDDDDEDSMSMGTNYHYSNSRRGGRGGGSGGSISVGDDGDAMMMDDDNLDAASRSAGGYEDRMSDDDGSASLVGFGEGAGSTVSGPIYHRRPIPPPTGSSAGAMAANNSSWGALERTNSGLSDMAVTGSTNGGSAAGGGNIQPPPNLAGIPGGAALRRSDFVRSPLEHVRDTHGGGSSGGSDSLLPSGVGSSGGSGASPAALQALQERRDARLINGMAHDSRLAASTSAAPTAPTTSTVNNDDDDDDVFVDTTTSGPVPVGSSAPNADSSLPPLMGTIFQAQPSNLRETQRPRSHQQQQQNHYHHQHQYQQHGEVSQEREAAEQLLRSVGRPSAYEERELSVAARYGASDGHPGPGSSGTEAGAGPAGGGPPDQFYFEDRR